MKINAALIGSGNIGTDLLYKALRSQWINPVWMVGIDPDSEGLARARDKGLKTTHAGVDGLLPHIEEDNIQIAFDATSAYVHADNAAKLGALAFLFRGRLIYCVTDDFLFNLHLLHSSTGAGRCNLLQNFP